MTISRPQREQSGSVLRRRPPGPKLTSSSMTSGGWRNYNSQGNDAHRRHAPAPVLPVALVATRPPAPALSPSPPPHPPALRARHGSRRRVIRLRVSAHRAAAVVAPPGAAGESGAVEEQPEGAAPGERVDGQSRRERAQGQNAVVAAGVVLPGTQARWQRHASAPRAGGQISSLRVPPAFGHQRARRKASGD